jgi:hypothetical protein
MIWRGIAKDRRRIPREAAVGRQRSVVPARKRPVAFVA